VAHLNYDLTIGVRSLAAEVIVDAVTYLRASEKKGLANKQKHINKLEKTINARITVVVLLYSK